MRAGTAHWSWWSLRWASAGERVVTWDAASQKFTVTAHDLTKRHTYSEEFDDVVVASGHFSTPNIPYFDGFETFPGRVMHAHDFRDALEFKGKDILVVGTSYSAEDIASQCHKYGCKSVIISHRTNPTGFKWPKSFTEKPLLQKVQGNRVTFKDGSAAKVDAIILCTGYLHYFPFLADDLRLETRNRLWPLGLYKGCVWEKNPRLFYIGMQDQWYTFNMFDAQAWYARDVMLGRINLPSEAEMHADNAEWRRREEAIADAHDAIVFQGEHVRDLIGLTDYPSFDINGVNEAFFQWKDHKKQDIMNFRDNGYRSVMTGTMAPKHHTPWIEALDDSMEAYLRAPAEPARTSA